VTWNRVRSAEEDPNGRRSRVLLISGPRHLVEPRAMCAYLDTKMVYQLDDIIHLGTSRDGNRILLEYRFGSFRCQAEAARMALMREYRDLGVMCEYGELSISSSLVVQSGMVPLTGAVLIKKAWTRAIASSPRRTTASLALPSPFLPAPAKVRCFWIV
jgi:hypothetical protein